jgi:hypothetical protein
MAETKHLLILANSVRAKKHCVAGLLATHLGEIDVSGKWIRLADPRDTDGAVPFASTICPGRGSVRPLQLIKVVLQGNCCDANHPEDWNFDPDQEWQYESTMDFTKLSSITQTPLRLWHDGTNNNSVNAGYVPQMGQGAATLYLIKAPAGWTFTFWKEWNKFEKRDDVKRKLSFNYAGQVHEFSVTDAAFTSRHSIYKRATETHQTLTVPNADNVYFCLSLTKLTPEFNRKHYKICATIFEP